MSISGSTVFTHVNFSQNKNKKQKIQSKKVFSAKNVMLLTERALQALLELPQCRLAAKKKVSIFIHHIDRYNGAWESEFSRVNKMNFCNFNFYPPISVQFTFWQKKARERERKSSNFSIEMRKYHVRGVGLAPAHITERGRICRHNLKLVKKSIWGTVLF